MNTAPSLSPGHSLDQLSDSELLTVTRSLVGRSNQLLAALLAHLAEVEARGIHRTRACPSLYTYCIYELRFSEDEAYRRVAASRWVRRFPALLEAIASGELHLTGLLMLGPHLTEHNVDEVLRRAKHRTKKELAALVRVLDPLPDVPPRIEPLGPAPTPLAPLAPGWSAFVQAMCPVRELAPGERPRDWMAGDKGEVANDVGDSEARSSDEDRVENDAACSEATGDATSGTAGAPSAESLALASFAPARVEPQRYRVQFTANFSRIPTHSLPTPPIQRAGAGHENRTRYGQAAATSAPARPPRPTRPCRPPPRCLRTRRWALHVRQSRRKTLPGNARPRDPSSTGLRPGRRAQRSKSGSSL